MRTTSPHPAVEPAVGILNLGSTLCLRPAENHDARQVDLPPFHFLQLAGRLGELYELVFPDQPEWLDQEVVDWAGEADVAAAVERFLGRVNTLFPVHDEIWDADLDAIEWRLAEIPVRPMGYDLWHDDWADLAEPAPYLLHLQHSRGDAERPRERDTFATLYPEHQVPLALEPLRLLETLHQMPVPQAELAALPDLIQMLDQSTGNVWLDIGELTLAEGGYPEWSRENVVWLAEEWRAARPVLDGVLALLHWRNKSAAATAGKLTAVRDALLAAHERRQTHGPTPSRTPATPA